MRKALILFTILAVLLSVASSVSAAGTVTYNGTAQDDFSQ